MATIKSGNKRKRRNIWKRRGRAFLRFNRGVWTHPNLSKGTDYEGMVFHVPYEREQPQAYLYYPQP